MPLSLTTLFLSLAVVVAAASPKKKKASRSVAVSLSADWPTLAVSPALEASEFFAEASQASFWEFTKRITTGATADNLATTNAVLAHTLITARTMAPPLFHTVLEVSLDTRAFAPAVEFQRQLALASSNAVQGACSSQFAQGLAWSVVVWPDAPTQPVAACTPDALDINSRPVPSTLDTAEPVPTPAVTVNEHDHMYPSRPLSPDVPIVYLQGLIGTPSFKVYHDKLVYLANEGNLVYVLRHAPTLEVAVSPVTYLRGMSIFCISQYTLVITHTRYV